MANVELDVTRKAKGPSKMVEDVVVELYSDNREVQEMLTETHMLQEIPLWNINSILKKPKNWCRYLLNDAKPVKKITGKKDMQRIEWKKLLVE